MARTIKLAVIPGDGIGVEVIEQANRVLDAVLEGTGVSIDRTEFELGAERYLATGDTMPEAQVSASAGEVRNIHLRPLPEGGVMRLGFLFVPGKASVADLHAVLVGPKGALSETWLARWSK